MPILLEFSVNNEKYGVVKTDRNEANRYINQITQLLRERKILKSLVPQGSGYRYSLVNDSRIFVKLSNLNNETYQIDIFDDNDFLKSYQTKSYQQAATVMLDNQQFNVYLYIITNDSHSPLACVNILNELKNGTIAVTENTGSVKPDWLQHNSGVRPLAILFSVLVIILELAIFVLGFKVNIWLLMIAILLVSIVLKYTALRKWSTNDLYRTALLAPTTLTAIATGLADLYIASNTTGSLFASIISAAIDVSIIVLLYIIASTDFKSLKDR